MCSALFKSLSSLKSVTCVNSTVSLQNDKCKLCSGMQLQRFQSFSRTHRYHLWSAFENAKEKLFCFW